MSHSWIKSFPGAIIVCDTGGIILEMNDQAVESFREDGGSALIGKNLFDCHPEPARSRLEEMLKMERQNIYTVEKHGTQTHRFTQEQFWIRYRKNFSELPFKG